MAIWNSFLGNMAMGGNKGGQDEYDGDADKKKLMTRDNSAVDNYMQNFVTNQQPYQYSALGGFTMQNPNFGQQPRPMYGPMNPMYQPQPMYQGQHVNQFQGMNSQQSGQDVVSAYIRQFYGGNSYGRF